VQYHVKPRGMSGTITIRGAREHNLRGIDLDLPRDALIVVTGVSGSGKSSLAFDTLYQEGQRRFLESLSPYARQFLGQMEKPDVDKVEGISPTLSIDQKTVNRNPRSTVGTITEIYDHLRLLYARIGTPRCPLCLRAIARRSPGDLADQLLREAEGRRAHVLAPVIRDRKGEYRAELEKWAKDGWLRARIDGEVRLLEDPVQLARYEKHTVELVIDRLTLSLSDRPRLVEAIERSLRMAEGVVSILLSGAVGEPDEYTLHAIERACPDHGISIPELEPRLFSFNAPQGACPTCMGIGAVIQVGKRLVPAPRDADAPQVCPTCVGKRLNPIALAVDFRGKGIHDASRMTVEDARLFFEGVTLSETEAKIGEGIVREIRERIQFLEHVGLGYLSLDRSARTLSGGEAQRIRLAACVGSGLQGVTYVLDEPSIGLHPRDNRRLLDALIALRDAGNTVVVVEHDRETMECADHIVDIGPGAGRLGGVLVGEGHPSRFIQLDTATARYLRDEDTIPLPATRRKGDGGVLKVRGASSNNLKDVDLDIPLGTFTVFTGVSGSGKSTLLFDVIEKGLTTGSLVGSDAIDKVIEIDQQPIGRTPRSNPATYSGAWDLVRDLYASLPEAKLRGYAKGQFSFNVAGGRCEACQGAGVRTIEMSFLADVEIPCETCSTRRFNRETLEVLWKGKSIADVLEMTIAEAVEFFAAHKKLHRILETMARVGLGYVHLGQTATTLSGGEAQRLKLASELHRPPVKKRGAIGTEAIGRTVYLLDEPTTGLHFQDVRVLVGALQALVEVGHTVLVIEHNTDLVKTADLLIEMGPEGGVRGGRVLAVGTPEQIARTDTPTGHVLAALKDFGGQPVAFAAERPPASYGTGGGDLEIRGARRNNLRGIDVSLPRGKMTVVTGVSGSGKTSLAFDTIFAEGQRRYVECLSTYARRFLGRLDRAPVDSVRGLAPSIAIDQRNSGGNARSTVATVTELQDHFRLLWANLGVPHCPTCDAEVRAFGPSGGADHLARTRPGKGRLVAKLPAGTKSAWLREQGFVRGWVAGSGGKEGGGKEVDLETVETVAAVVVDRFDPNDVDRARVAEAIALAYRFGHDRATFHGATATVPLAQAAQCPDHGRIHTEPLTPRHFSFNHWLGACPACDGIGRQLLGSVYVPCPGCKGGRLKEALLSVRFAGMGIGALGAMTVDEASTWFTGLKLHALDARIAEQPLREVRARLGFLSSVGLGFLTLGRTADTLSGGEAQRIRLASQLGGGLTGVIYVLDEPTIGLHPRDTARLLDTLEKLTDNENTLVVVEHDPETIRRADHVIDLGPGAGEYGGRVIGSAPPDKLGPESITGAWLRGERFIPVPTTRRTGGEPIRIKGATRNNLNKVNVDLPSNTLIAITGVSGSGKSTLIMDLLVGGLAGRDVPAKVTLPEGEWSFAVVDQSPIGRSPRSTPATYAGVMDPLRALFAATNTAKERGYDISRFSYNTKSGGCSVCGGYGSELVEMHFLSNVWVRCDACSGRRYARETLEVRWKGLSIADVLDLRVDDALELFAAHRSIARPLQALVDVGLGYVRLGQPGTELSGGEAQRVKLACGLAARQKRCLYVLDEPTTGLHLADIEKLVTVFDRLVEAGNTVIVVEHHLDVIRHADHVVDMGPEGGELGGKVVAQGTPEKVQKVKASWTGRALAGTLAGGDLAKTG
jgi:excinuclease ABC subunit A